MDINLFDTNFEQSVCSVAWAVPAHVRYVKRQMQWGGVSLFTDAWTQNPVVTQAQAKHKIGWLHEPGCLWPHLYRPHPFWQEFDLLLSYRKDFIFSYHTTFCPYGGIWVPPSQRGIRPKTKNISMLYGAKRTTAGHLLRHEIGSMYHTGIDYFGARGTPVDYSPATKIRVHEQYRYSIVVETCKEDWLFTEILLDAFVLGTVPIFWGCPGIGTFFDDRGIITFDTAEELSYILPQLTPHLYESLRPHLVENFKLAQEYAVTEDWLYTHILKGRYDD